MATDRCHHDAGWPCPWPRCPCGTTAVRRVVCGPGGAVVYERAIDVTSDGELVLRWAAREERAERAVAA